MTVSQREREDKELAWKRAGKGNGLRWLILRDLVAGLSVYPMTMMKAQDYLLMVRGISWNTSRTMIQELERLGAVECYQEPEFKTEAYRTTSRGVTIFLRKRLAIPVRLVQAALTTMNVSAFEAVADSVEKEIEKQ